MKKFLCASLGFIMLAAIAQSASFAGEKGGEWLKGGGSNTIYVITASYATPMFETEARIASETAKKLGYAVKAVSHDDDLTKQDSIIEIAIAEGAAGILLDNAGAEGSVEAVRKARAAGIPTVIIDRELATGGVAIAQLVSNNYQGAQAVAEVFVEAMGEKGQYAELLGKETETACVVRSQGFHDVIDQYDELVMVAQETANWEQTTAYAKMETILQANPKIKGVICGNDPMALGAAAACKAAGITNAIIISVDGSDEARDAIIAGDMTATALQQAALMAEQGIVMLDRYLKTGSTGADAEKVLIDCMAITADNAKYLKQFVYSEK
jgi:ABC-type sugar transport system, periplasmic component